MRFILLLAAIALSMLCSLPTQAAGARVNAFDKVFGHVPCNARGVCIVNGNPGGVIDDFTAAASAINRSGFKVVIAGPCLSACTIFADKARTHVCITKYAVFGFHKAHNEDTGDVDANPWPGHSRDIVAWVDAHGGYPDEKPLMMSYEDARQFWQTCEK